MFKIKELELVFTQHKEALTTKFNETATLGQRNISYLGAKLWNDNVCSFSDAREVDFLTLNTCIDDPSVLLVDGSDFPCLRWFHNILANHESSMCIDVKRVQLPLF